MKIKVINTSIKNQNLVMSFIDTIGKSVHNSKAIFNVSFMLVVNRYSTMTNLCSLQ